MSGGIHKHQAASIKPRKHSSTDNKERYMRYVAHYSICTKGKKLKIC